MNFSDILADKDFIKFLQTILQKKLVIYHATNHIVCEEGCEDQGIDAAIEQGLSQIAGRAGQAVELMDVTTTVVPRTDNPMKHSVYVTVLAKHDPPKKRWWTSKGWVEV